MSNQTTDPRTTTPRNVGTRRPVKNIKPGWWVHMEANPGYEDRGDAWEQVKWIADYTNGARQIVFDRELDPDDPQDGNMVVAHKDDTAVTLTEREAKRHGLGVEAAEGTGPATTRWGQNL
jgi:hypothetical protein